MTKALEHQSARWKHLFSPWPLAGIGIAFLVCSYVAGYIQTHMLNGIAGGRGCATPPPGTEVASYGVTMNPLPPAAACHQVVNSATATFDQVEIHWLGPALFLFILASGCLLASLCVAGYRLVRFFK